jgi:hypothetical protein
MAAAQASRSSQKPSYPRRAFPPHLSSAAVTASSQSPGCSQSASGMAGVKASAPQWSRDVYRTPSACLGRVLATGVAYPRLVPSEMRVRGFARSKSLHRFTLRPWGACNRGANSSGGLALFTAIILTEQLSCRLLAIHVSKHLPVSVAQHKARGRFFDSPRRREAAFRHRR